MKKNFKMMPVRTNTKVNTIMSALAAFTAITTVAEPIPTDIPRAHEILPLASNCAIGPFGQTSKAGQYNQYCQTLTDAEKCLALIKNNMNQDGVLSKIRSEREAEKAVYCLEHFKAELLNND